MNDVMLDFETFGVGYDAMVIQVGACYFDRKTGEIKETFEQNVDLESSKKYGFEIDPSTVTWWMQQSEKAIKTLFDFPIDVYNVFYNLNEFLSDADAIWSHATFDYVLLTNHLRKLGIKPSFSYRVARDLRTITDVSGVDSRSYKQTGVAHNALDDCKYQVNYVKDCFKRLT